MHSHAELAHAPARRRRSRALPGLLSGLTLALAACGGADGGDATGATGSLDGPDRAIDPQTEDVYTVGALEGEDWETFGNIANVAFDRDGNLYVLDRDAAHIVQFSPGGEYVRTIGQKGEGPGELTQPNGLSVMPDGRLVVFDFGKQGFQVFGADGEYEMSVPQNPEEGLPGSEILPTPDGRLVTHDAIRFSFSADEGGSVDEPQGRPIEAFGLDGSHDFLYDAWQPPAPEEQGNEELSAGNARFEIRMDQMVAFEPRVRLGVLSDGRLAVVDSVGYRVKLVDGGAVTGTLERPIAPTVVDERIQDLERQRRLDELEEGSGSGSGRMIVVGSASGNSGGAINVGRDQINDMLRGRIESMGFAPSIPVIADMKVDWNDRLWIERTGAVPGEEGPTDIVTADGSYLGTIATDGLRIPDAFGPDGLVAYIEADELEVQHVRVARIADDQALESGS